MSIRECDNCGRDYSTTGTDDILGIPECPHCGWTPTGCDAGDEGEGIFVDEENYQFQVVDTNDAGKDELDEFVDQFDESTLAEHGILSEDLDELMMELDDEC